MGRNELMGRSDGRGGGGVLGDIGKPEVKRKEVSLSSCR